MITTTTKPIDFSSLPQDQQQQLQQLQLQFQEHQQEQQKAAAEAVRHAAEQQQSQLIIQQQQDYAAFAPQFDPTQAVQAVYDHSQLQPAYDQSYYAAYYQYGDPIQVQNPQQEQHYAYYQQDYANLYYQLPYPQPDSAQIYQAPVLEEPLVAVQEQALLHQQFSQPEPSRPLAGPPPAGLGQVQVQHQDNLFYSQQVGSGGGDRSLGSPAPPGMNPVVPTGLNPVVPPGLNPAVPPGLNPAVPPGLNPAVPPGLNPAVPPGLNPAAAAAVAALSQLTQFAGTMDAAERAMAGLQERQFYGRAGGYAQGGFLGQFGQEPMHPSQAAQSPFRVRGGGRTGQLRGGGRGGGRINSGPTSRGRGRGQGRGGSGHQYPVTSSAAASDVADGSSDEEHEALSAVADMAGLTVLARCEICKADCNSLEMLEKHNRNRHKRNLQKMLPGTISGGDNMLIEPVNPLGGLKQNVMRGGSGNGAARRVRPYHASARRQIEPHTPKVVIPLICELCNVKCDTREVFNCHLSGKKHISKLKKFEDHQTMYGRSGLTALYPHNPIPQNYSQGQPLAYRAPQPLDNYPLQFVGQSSNQISVQFFGGNNVNPPSGI